MDALGTIPPCDADSVNAKFLTQAGFVEKVAAGIYNLLPLGQRVLLKVNQIVREEMNRIEGQEILMPALHPIAAWEATGRDKTMDEILYRTKGAGGQDFVFGPSHEEIVTPLLAKYVQSYKDLPLSVYQIQMKFRNEPRAKSGMLRGREFGMKDMYSFHTSEEDLDAYYERVKEAYFRVYERCGLKSYLIEASGGAFSDKFSHEFSVETSAGEDTILLCDASGSAQNMEIATGKVPDPNHPEEDEKPLEMVEVKRGPSVADNAKAHGVPESRILKSVIYEIEGGGLLGVLIRGDLSVNELKLTKYLGKNIRPASTELLDKAGLVPGFISPVNVPESSGVSFVADHSIANLKNFVTGANKPGVDYVNANIGRDFVVKDFTDLVEVKGGFGSLFGDCDLREIKAVEVGNIFKLGTKFSESCDLYFTDAEGVRKPVVMGCYGIGTTRLVGTAVEASHDEKGIIWPKAIAPFHVHIVSLGADDEIMKAAKSLYEEFLSAGIEVLFDDRDERAGVKLTDADLIGIPVRIVVSKRTLENDSVEWKFRSSADAQMVKLSAVQETLNSFLNE